MLLRHCRIILATMSNEFFLKFRPFDKAETNWTYSTCFDFAERIKLRSTLLPKTATLSKQHCTLSKELFDFCSIRQCCFDNVAIVDWALYHTSNNVETTLSKQQATMSNVTSTLLLVWTGFYTAPYWFFQLRIHFHSIDCTQPK